MKGSVEMELKNSDYYMELFLERDNDEDFVYLTHRYQCTPYDKYDFYCLYYFYVPMNCVVEIGLSKYRWSQDATWTFPHPMKKAMDNNELKNLFQSKWSHVVPLSLVIRIDTNRLMNMPAPQNYIETTARILRKIEPYTDSAVYHILLD
jgi:hypothetical protein